jgi:hypothetical protein
MMRIHLKTGQVAAVLDITPKQLQNDVDAGYVRPLVTAPGRGKVRLYSFENVVQLKVLELLVQAYGLERSRAATMLAQAWPRRLTARAKVLVLPPADINLEPIRLPLSTIVAVTTQRLQHVLEAYREKKRGRPVGWPTQMRQTLGTVAEHLRDVSDEQITQEIAAYRATHRARTTDGAPSSLAGRTRHDGGHSWRTGVPPAATPADDRGVAADPRLDRR